MKKPLGFSENVPFKKGDVIVLLAGTEVKTRDRTYKLVRRQTVTIQHANNGCASRVLHMSSKDRSYYPENAEIYARFDELILDSETNPDPEEADRLRHEAYEIYVYTHRPEICWGGKNGWCYAALADAVAANPPKVETA